MGAGALPGPQIPLPPPTPVSPRVQWAFPQGPADSSLPTGSGSLGNGPGALGIGTGPLCAAAETGSETHGSGKSCCCAVPRALHLPPAPSPALQDLTLEDSPPPGPSLRCHYPSPTFPTEVPPHRPRGEPPPLEGPCPSSHPPAHPTAKETGSKWAQSRDLRHPRTPANGAGDAALNQPHLHLPAVARGPPARSPCSVPEGVLHRL